MWCCGVLASANQPERYDKCVLHSISSATCWQWSAGSTAGSGPWCRTLRSSVRSRCFSTRWTCRPRRPRRPNGPQAQPTRRTSNRESGGLLSLEDFELRVNKRTATTAPIARRLERAACQNPSIPVRAHRVLSEVGIGRILAVSASTSGHTRCRGAQCGLGPHFGRAGLAQPLVRSSFLSIGYVARPASFWSVAVPWRPVWLLPLRAGVRH